MRANTAAGCAGRSPSAGNRTDNIAHSASSQPDAYGHRPETRSPPGSRTAVPVRAEEHTTASTSRNASAYASSVVPICSRLLAS